VALGDGDRALVLKDKFHSSSPGTRGERPGKPRRLITPVVPLLYRIRSLGALLCLGLVCPQNQRQDRLIAWDEKPAVESQ
jgi:hypothetical protein